jgi:hypothetical protein
MHNGVAKIVQHKTGVKNPIHDPQVGKSKGTFQDLKPLFHNPDEIFHPDSHTRHPEVGGTLNMTEGTRLAFSHDTGRDLETCHSGSCLGASGHAGIVEQLRPGHTLPRFNLPFCRVEQPV